jgi:hypothetical protein
VVQPVLLVTVPVALTVVLAPESAVMPVFGFGRVAGLVRVNHRAAKRQ